MIFREIKKSYKLIDEIEDIDGLIKYVQSPERTLWVSTDGKVVRIIKKEHKTKVIQVLLEIRRELARELEELGVTEE